MATLTPPELTSATSVADSDLLVVWPVAGGGGPLKQVQFSVVTAAVEAALGSTYLQADNNLSELTNASTARDNLELGTVATQDTGTSGAAVPLLNASVTWSGTITATGFVGPLTGNVMGDLSGNAATATTAHGVGAGVVTPAGLSTGHPTWDTTGAVTVSGNVLVLNSGISSFEFDANTTINLWLDHANGSRFSFIRSTGVLFYQIAGVNVFHIDPSGNVVISGTLTQNGSP